MRAAPIRRYVSAIFFAFGMCTLSISSMASTEFDDTVNRVRQAAEQKAQQQQHPATSTVQPGIQYYQNKTEQQPTQIEPQPPHADEQQPTQQEAKPVVLDSAASAAVSANAQSAKKVTTAASAVSGSVAIEPNNQTATASPMPFLIGLFIVSVSIFWFGVIFFHKTISKFLAKKIESTSIKASPENTILFSDYISRSIMWTPIAYAACTLLFIEIVSLFNHEKFLDPISLTAGSIISIIVIFSITYKMRIDDRGVAYDPDSGIVEMPIGAQRLKLPVDSIRGIQMNGETTITREITSNANSTKIEVTEDTEHKAKLTILTYGKPLKLEFSSKVYDDNFSIVANACALLISRAANLEA